MRKEILGVSFVFVVLMSLGFVSAANDFIDDGFGKLGEAFESIFTPIFTLDGVTDDFLFAKVLIFILIFAVVFMALNKVEIFKRNKPTRVIVAMIVSILAVRYLKETDFTRALLLPYGALGGAITIFLPLMIYFFFVHTSFEGGFGRRAAWAIYGIIFIFLWGSQDPANTTSNWIYLPALGFVLISFIFDKKIHEYFKMGDYNKGRSASKRRQRMKLKRYAIELDELFEKGAISLSEYDKEIVNLNEKIKRLSKY